MRSRPVVETHRATLRWPCEDRLLKGVKKRDGGDEKARLWAGLDELTHGFDGERAACGCPVLFIDIFRINLFLLADSIHHGIIE